MLFCLRSSAGLALLAALAACGERASPPLRPAGEPATWSATRDEAPAGGTMLDLRAGEPCRVRVRVLGVPEGVAAETVRPLAAGESVRLWVDVQVETAPRAGAPVSADDAAAGRTEGWLATLGYGWSDGVGGRRPQVTGTRPGRGRALGSWTVVPPKLPAALAYDRDLEVASVAIADGGGDLTLEGRESGSRVRGPLDAGAGDRVTLLRLVVRLERMGP